jgi:hypothetical protein
MKNTKCDEMPLVNVQHSVRSKGALANEFTGRSNRGPGSEGQA